MAPAGRCVVEGLGGVGWKGGTGTSQDLGGWVPKESTDMCREHVEVYGCELCVLACQQDSRQGQEAPGEVGRWYPARAHHGQAAVRAMQITCCCLLYTASCALHSERKPLYSPRVPHGIARSCHRPRISALVCRTLL